MGDCPGLLFVISGPSGVGKNTVLTDVLKLKKDLFYSISATTRPPRGQEKDGVNYYFLTEEEFKKEIEKGGFLEWAKVYDCFYGTPKKTVLDRLNKGKHVILDVDIQGAAQIRKNYPDSILIFLYPPSLDELKLRLHRRNTEDPAAIQRRLKYLEKELSSLHLYDYVVVNDILEEASRRVEAIITAEEARTSRGYWRKYVKDFTLDKLHD